jgi:hypothetical protein
LPRLEAPARAVRPTSHAKTKRRSADWPDRGRQIARLGIVGLEIVDGKSERERRGKTMRRRIRQELAVEKCGQKQRLIVRAFCR